MTDTIRTAALLLPTVVAIAAIAVAARWRGKAEEEADFAWRANARADRAIEVQGDLQRETDRLAGLLEQEGKRARAHAREAEALRREKVRILAARAVEIRLFATPPGDRTVRLVGAHGPAATFAVEREVGAAWTEIPLERVGVSFAVEAGEGFEERISALVAGSQRAIFEAALARAREAGVG